MIEQDLTEVRDFLDDVFGHEWEEGKDWLDTLCLNCHEPLRSHRRWCPERINILKARK